MAALLSCRTLPGGGAISQNAAVFSNPPDITGALLAQLVTQCQGRDVLIATHGFNVDQPRGAEHLAEWQSLLTLPQDSVYIGYLWPGDSLWLHALVYPEAAKTAMQSGERLAEWLNTNLAGAASLSFASHSLGARVVLQAIRKLDRAFRIRRLLLMAGAVDDTCLGEEFADAARRIEKISSLSSSKDDVLKWAFPLGNPISGIFAEGHPFWHAAIGRDGPKKNPPAPAALDLVCRVPDGWNFAHGDYVAPSPPPPGYNSLPYTLPVNAPATPVAPPIGTPAGYEAPPGTWASYWKSAWTAAIASTRFP